MKHKPAGESGERHGGIFIFDYFILEISLRIQERNLICIHDNKNVMRIHLHTNLSWAITKYTYIYTHVFFYIDAQIKTNKQNRCLSDISSWGNRKKSDETIMADISKRKFRAKTWNKRHYFLTNFDFIFLYNSMIIFS